jgi:predicted GIY-YIG superfamily endonuclease
MYEKSVVYQLKCGGCQKRYAGQTGRNFQQRYKEHIHSIRTNNTSSKYAQHIIETQHAYGPIEDTMEVLHLDRKGQKLNTWERFYIYKLGKDGIQLNDTYADSYNPIFRLVSKHRQGTGCMS